MNDMTMLTQQTSLRSSQSTPSASPNQVSDLNATANGESGVRFFELLTSALETNGELVLTEQLKKSAEILGAQMNAQILTVNPMLAAMLINQSAQGVQMNQVTGQQAATLESMATTQATSIVTGAQLPPEILTQLETTMSAASELSEATAASLISPELAASSPPLIIIDAKGKAPLAEVLTKEASPLQAQTQFGRAVEQAQQMLKSTDAANASATTALDIDELQKRVDSGEFLAQAAAPAQQYSVEASTIKDLPATSESGEPLDAQDIFSQLKFGAAHHAQNGSNDFTIKLTPEGLGEITVRLLEEGGKITMSIAASDTNVQRLLSSELINLRDVMRPYNVEVAQVTQSNEAQTMDLQQQLQQQFSQRQFMGQHQQSPSFAPSISYSENTEADEQVQKAIVSDSILDAYV